MYLSYLEQFYYHALCHSESVAAKWSTILKDRGTAFIKYLQMHQTVLQESYMTLLSEMVTQIL